MLDVAPATRLDARHNDSADSLASPRMPCRGNGAPRWCVARTQSQGERWAETNLRRLGFTTYLPLYAARRRDRVVRSMFHTVELPLFPSYLFVAHDQSDLWRPIREAPGVAAVLTCGSRLQYASAGAVEALQATDGTRGTHPTTPAATWRPGAVVRVARGIFYGMPGVVLSADADIAQVSVLFLGQLRTVSLPAGFLTARDEA